MEKDFILKQRKELKRKSRQVVKSHFFTLFFLSLVMILFGSEFNLSIMSWGSSSLEISGNVIDSILDADPVINEIIEGRYKEGKKISESLAKEIDEQGDISKALGRTNGVIAQLVRSVSAGKPAMHVAGFFYSFVRNETGVGLIIWLLRYAFKFLVFALLINVYSVICRRFYLEARVYENVHYGEALFLAAVKKWRKACWVMLVREIFYFLWCLTVMGAFVKYYSYAAVPYIVAENPDVGAREAITLSRKMMDGHKMEMFKYDLTMIGWILLGIVTAGISEIAWGVSYRMACRTEFYARLREDAIRRNVEGTELLNDRWLYEKADRIVLYETYFDVVDEITVLHENRMELKGVKKIAADWLGVWLDTLDRKKKYDDLEGRRFAIRQYQSCMNGTSYPQRLNPLWNKKEIAKQGNFSFFRHYSICTIFLLFILFSFVGWSWEVALHYMQTGDFVNRGTLLGPWLPIYGSGGVVVLMLCSRFRRNPVAEFFTAIVLCGTLEYFTAWYLETRFHQRWWSYDGYFLNLHGRICAEGLLVFGVGCCIVVYLIAPVFDFLLSKVNNRILIPVCLVLAVLFAADEIHSSIYPNMAEGAIEATESVPASGGGSPSASAESGADAGETDSGAAAEAVA